jgi:hypothetical protein
MYREEEEDFEGEMQNESVFSGLEAAYSPNSR